MRNLLLLTGAAALLGSAPTLAKPGAHGAHAKTNMTTAKVAKAKFTTMKALPRAKDRNRNGILDTDEALARKYGGALCPPGLWKKTPQCVPPGQANRLFRVGQRVPLRYKWITSYSNIPLALRDEFDLDPNFRYVYRNNVIYVIDPTTNLITNIINAVL